MQASRVLNEGSTDESLPKVPEVPEAFSLFCGTQWRNAYALIFYVSFLSCSWVLAILFAHTMSSSMPFIYHPEEVCTEHDGEVVSELCNTRYLINMFLFALLTTPLALMDVKEQWYVQNTLAFIRVCRMLLMCITPMLVGEIGDSVAMRASFPGSFNFQTATSSPPIFVGTLYGLSQVLSASVFSQFLNGSIPIIIDSLEDRNNYIRVLNITFIVCYVLYVWLSIVVSVQFGSTTANPCNLNWTGYRWPIFGEECTAGSFCDISAKLVEFIIVFCPAIDVVSAYPFISIILGNSITEMVLGANPSHDTAGNIPSVNEESGLLGSNVANPNSASGDSSISYTLWNRFFRFSMNIVPMILAVTVANFSTVIQLTGAISVLICLVFPPLLSMKCNAYLAEKYKYFSDCALSKSLFLSWIDEHQTSSTQDEKINQSWKSYGAMQNEYNGTRQLNGVVPFNSNEIIETEFFKWIFLSVGVCMTCIIFYISTHG